jgi:hypothetical protein
MIRIALLCAASCTLCNHRTENDFIGIASIGPVLSKIAVTVAFFFEGGPGGRTNRMEKLHHLPTSTTCFKP